LWFNSLVVKYPIPMYIGQARSIKKVDNIPSDKRPCYSIEHERVQESRPYSAVVQEAIEEHLKEKL
jgi:hypothetical protein